MGGLTAQAGRIMPGRNGPGRIFPRKTGGIIGGGGLRLGWGKGGGTGRPTVGCWRSPTVTGRARPMPRGTMHADDVALIHTLRLRAPGGPPSYPPPDAQRAGRAPRSARPPAPPARRGAIPGRGP